MNAAPILKRDTLTKQEKFSWRFTQIVTMLCDQRPPPELVSAWLNPDAEDIRLQLWVIEHMRERWAQGIELLDAAHAIADTPAEGSGGLERSALTACIESLRRENEMLKAQLSQSLEIFL
jgi:hypothetical protein